MKNNVLVTLDEEGKKLVVLPHIIFMGKRSISWEEVEKYLLRYVGNIFEIEETKDMVYIGTDFTNEFAGSLYTRNLRGSLAKAKANLVQGLHYLS